MRWGWGWGGLVNLYQVVPSLPPVKVIIHRQSPIFSLVTNTQLSSLNANMFYGLKCPVFEWFNQTIWKQDKKVSEKSIAWILGVRYSDGYCTHFWTCKTCNLSFTIERKRLRICFFVQLLFFSFMRQTMPTTKTLIIILTVLFKFIFVSKFVGYSFDVWWMNPIFVKFSPK